MRLQQDTARTGTKEQFHSTPGQIERLEEIGFKWKVQETFEQRYHDLKTFKSEFGYCNVSCKAAYTSLGNGCGTMRHSYNQIHKGQTPWSNLTQDEIECLEEMNFK